MGRVPGTASGSLVVVVIRVPSQAAACDSTRPPLLQELIFETSDTITLIGRGHFRINLLFRL